MTLRAMHLLVGVAAISAILTVGATLVNHGHHNAAAATFCGKGVPASKCNPIQTPVNPHPLHVAQPAPFWPSPPLVAAGSGFFSGSQWSQLQAQYGTITVVRFKHSTEWVLIGNGMSQTQIPASGTPGGALLAIDNCAGQEASCLNPNALHNVSSFVTVPLPDPKAVNVQLETTFGGRLLYLTDGPAFTPIIFDLHTFRYYRGTMTVVNQIMSGSDHPSPITSTSPIPSISLR